MKYKKNVKFGLHSTRILRGKSLVSNFDLPDNYHAKLLALDGPLY